VQHDDEAEKSTAGQDDGAHGGLEYPHEHRSGESGPA
jgi:hypothetical protein